MIEEGDVFAFLIGFGLGAADSAGASLVEERPGWPADGRRADAAAHRRLAVPPQHEVAMNPPGATLAQEARAEADAVDQELKQHPELAQQAKRPDISLVGDQTEPAEPAEGETQPGDPGTAEPGEEKPDEYSPPEPTEDEVTKALAVLQELRTRVNEYSAEQTVEALIAIVDIVPALRRPEEWPAKEDDEYHKAPEIAEICTLLLKGCRSKLTLSPKDVTFLWRNKAKWTRHGVTQRSGTNALDTRTQFLAKGVLAVVEVNFHHWKTLNPLQKVFTCYRALRVLDRDASARHADFEGYFDELELFGPRVFREMAQLKEAIERGSDRELPFQISIFDQADGED